jgi:hypothetical protein
MECAKTQLGYNCQHLVGECGPALSPLMAYTLYIGSNNRTKRLERAKIERILARNHEGFTLSEAVGYWQGVKEKTAVVSLACERIAALATIQELKTELDQESVAYQEAPEMRFA